jgi:hypothetical protein
MHTDISHGAPEVLLGGAAAFGRPFGRGTRPFVTDDRVGQRAAELLPEERAAGSADPRAQAEAILAESDRREDWPEPAEERRADQTVVPGETTR